MVIMEAIEKAGYKPGKDICIAIDSAASAFFEEREICHGRRKET